MLNVRSASELILAPDENDGPRDMDRMADKCYYVPICDHNGGMLNDPVAIKLAQDRSSIADGDLLQRLAIASNMDVGVEPDGRHLVQGPKADELMSVFWG